MNTNLTTQQTDPLQPIRDARDALHYIAQDGYIYEGIAEIIQQLERVAVQGREARELISDMLCDQETLDMSIRNESLCERARILLGEQEPIDESRLPLDSGYYWASGIGPCQIPTVVYVNADDPDAGMTRVEVNGHTLHDGHEWLTGVRFKGPIHCPF